MAGSLCVVAGAAVLASVGASQASASEVATRSYLSKEGTFVVPANVSSIEVVAVGGAGGFNARSVSGGRGARVTATLAVTSGETLYVHVGGEGASATVAGHAGAGGGASDVRTLPVSEGLVPDPRLIVAGGGGGAGGQGPNGTFGPGSGGGNAGESGESTVAGFGGEPGTQTEGGEGGQGECGGGSANPSGENGALEIGGIGGHCTRGEIYGGNGGAGYYGGGGGGAGGPTSVTKEGAAGGGGGSSLVPAGGTLTGAGSTPPQVTISYVQPPNAPAVITGTASNVIRDSATVAGSVNPEDSEVTSCVFEYGETEAYGQTAACTPSPGSGIAPVSVSASLAGLTPATPYHYRVAATNANGTSFGADRTFTTTPHDPPTVISLSPTAGITSGGTSVTITGSEFYEVASVRFGSANAASYTVNSPESITAVSPPGSGIVDVTVATASGTSALNTGDKFTYVAPPVITHVSPAAGPEGGGTKVTINGSGLSGATAVTFGGNAASFVVNSDSTIVATSPAGVGAVDIAVSKPVGGTTSPTSADRFTYEVAAPPEYGRCIKVPIGAGRFSSATCTTLGGEKKYEWYPAFGSNPLLKKHFTIKIKVGTEAVLQTVGGHIVTCKGESGTGEYTGNRTVGDVKLTFTGCHLGTLGNCQSSGAGEGEVVTATLSGELGVIKASTEGTAKNLVGTDLKPAGAEAFAAFVCAGSTTVSVTGSVIGEVKRNAMTTLGTLKYLQAKGVQKPTRFVGGEEDDLLSSFAEATPEHSGLNLSAVVGTEEKVEVSSIY
ncbi:MAG TPA: IPT/TIG domain-containing protein [Solirubrobacteraceae bacterium]|jgi:hypothetical protein|nr:IPT/TIG domain-containing protein [Solirubrobacteraceae bacterium]